MKATEENFVRFLEGSVQFRIPIYQRKYSWTTKHCEKLFDDIIKAGKNSSDVHFFGSIVYVSEQFQKSAVQHMTVIDGQQRLTTVMLLLFSFSKIIENKDIEITTNQIRNNYLFNTDQKVPENKLKLILTRSDRETLNSVLEEKPLPNSPSKNILDNFEYFEKKIKNLENGYVKELWEGIRKLKIVDIMLTTPDDNPQLIFESLNSTGLGLSQTDLIRNFLLMGLERTEQETLYTKFWMPMEKRITESKKEDEFDEFLQDFLTVKQIDIPIKREVYDKYKEYFHEENKDNFSCVEELEYYSKFYQILALEVTDDQQIKEAVSNINKLRVTVTYPLLLQVFSDEAKGVITKDDVLEIMELIQSYIFRRQIVVQMTSGHGRIFATLYDRIDKGDRQRYVESVKAGLQIQTGKYRFPSDEEFLSHLLVADMYNVKGNIYPLLKLENFKRKKEKVGILDSPPVTIEHILPQNPNLLEDWRNELGDEWKLVQKEKVNRLGNLTITELNSEYSDSSFQIKKEKGYDNSIYHLSGELKHLEHWNGDEIDKRTTNLADLALEVWKHPKLPDEILDKYRDADEEEEVDDEEPDLEDTWEYKCKLATEKSIKVQDELIKKIDERFDCIHASQKDHLMFYTKEPMGFPNLFMVMSCRKDFTRIAFRVNPETYVESDVKDEKGKPKITSLKSTYWYRNRKDIGKAERRMRVYEDDIPLALEQLEHAYKTTRDYDNYKNK